MIGTYFGFYIWEIFLRQATIFAFTFQPKNEAAYPVKYWEITTLAKKIETTARPGVQARALSSVHVPVLWHAGLSQFFWPG